MLLPLPQGSRGGRKRNWKFGRFPTMNYAQDNRCSRLWKNKHYFSIFSTITFNEFVQVTDGRPWHPVNQQSEGTIPEVVTVIPCVCHSYCDCQGKLLNVASSKLYSQNFVLS